MTSPDTLAAIDRKLDQLLARQSEPAPRFLPLGAASRYAGLSEKSLRRLIDRGDLKGLRPCPGKVLVDRQEIDQLFLGATRQLTRGRGIRTG